MMNKTKTSNFAENFFDMDIKYRQIAIDWLNSNRDFDKGVSILLESHFKPGVVSKLIKDKARPIAKERLKVQMYALIGLFGDNPETSDTDAELNVFDGKESPADADETASKSIFDAESTDGNIGAVIKRYCELYRQRNKAFNDLKAVGEKNDDESCMIRVQLQEQIEKNTESMERLYPLYEKYTQTKEDISEEDAEAAIKDTAVSEEHKEEALSNDYESMDKDELAKLQYSLQKRITRAKNNLLYQTESKQEVENPMPESPKRVKIETRIARLEEDLLKVKYAIARK